MSQLKMTDRNVNCVVNSLGQVSVFSVLGDLNILIVGWKSYVVLELILGQRPVPRYFDTWCLYIFTSNFIKSY